MGKDDLGSVFCCPVSKGTLVLEDGTLCCKTSERRYAIHEGIPDFFIEEDEAHSIFPEDLNRKWLLEDVAVGRDIVYGEYTRRLKGMQFVMDMLGKWSHPGFRILEVGCGTGHFTKWMTEVCDSDSEIFAFDFSQYMLASTQLKIGQPSNVKLFKANARGPMPFPEGHFDFILQRLAPFGPRAFGSENWAMKYLKPGGHYIFAGWDHEFIDFERLATAGYVDTELHRWEYKDVQSIEEYIGGLMEGGGHTREEAEKKAKSVYSQPDEVRVRKEHVIVGKKEG